MSEAMVGTVTAFLRSLGHDAGVSSRADEWINWKCPCGCGWSMHEEKSDIHDGVLTVWAEHTGLCRGPADA